MKRKIISILITFTLVLTLVPNIASAKGNAAPKNAQYDYSSVSDVKHGASAKTVKFEVKAAKAAAKDLQKLEKKVQQANKRIEQLVKKAQKTKVNDVDQLLQQVEVIVAEVFAYAKRIGAVVVCEYTEYYIDGQYVLIDPLRVVSL